MKSIVSICALIFVSTACFATGMFPETYIVDGATWHYAARMASPNKVLCDPSQVEGSYWDTVFNVMYTPDDYTITFKQPNMGEFSCANTLRHNKNYHKLANDQAYCGGSLVDCIAYHPGEQ